MNAGGESADTSGRPRKHRWRIRIVAVLASLLFALGVGEVTVRLTGAAPRIKILHTDGADTVYQRSTNAILAYELKPSYRNDHADLSQSYPSTNAYGQRDIERAVAKQPGVRRIILLGDSVVEGHGLADIDDTMSRQLERLYTDGRTEVLNFGVSGYCTLAEVELLAVKGMQFDPDVVVLVFTENDFDNFNREAFALGSARARPSAVKWLFEHSHLARLVMVQLNLFDFGLETDPVAWNRKATGDNNVVVGLDRLALLAKTHGFDVLIAVWPLFTDEGVFDVNFMPVESQNLIIEQLAAAHGMPTVRLSTRFQGEIASATEPVNPRLHYTIGDGFHPSQEGCHVAARALEEVLTDVGLMDASTEPANVVEQAIEAARVRGQVKPDYARVHTNAGRALAEAGKLDEAEREFQKALLIDSQHVSALVNLGTVRRAKGDIDGALALYHKALAQDQDDLPAHFNLAEALRDGGHMDQAVAHYEAALRIQPDFSGAHAGLGWIRLEQGRFEEAQEHFQRVSDVTLRQRLIATLEHRRTARPNGAPAQSMPDR